MQTQVANDIDMTVKTDEELDQMLLDEWHDILAQLWLAANKTLASDEKRYALYAEKLGGIPLGLLEKAIDRVLREHRYSNVPALGEVWAALRKELGNPYNLDQAVEEWGARLLERGIYRFEGAEPEEVNHV